MKRLRFALLGACAAALVLVTTTALAGSGVGATFNLGQTNSVNATSTLTGATAAPQLSIANTSTNSAATALTLSVASGRSPFKVNSSTKVFGLNADLLDGRDSTGLPYWKLGGNAGTTSSNFIGTTDAKPLFVKANGKLGVAIDATGKVGMPSFSDNATLNVAMSAPTSAWSSAVRAVNSAVDAGYGVYGWREGTGVGVFGHGGTKGVSGESPSGYGVTGSSPSGYGVYGDSSTGTGVVGNAPTRGVTGTLGVTCPGTYGVGGCGAASYGVYGNSTSADGVHGQSSSGSGVVGDSTDGVGVYGYSTNGSAGYFEGDVYITGTLHTAAAGDFKIDDPLDPAHKVLQHSSVASPDMLDIYNGNVTTDGKGFATVRLPSWFQGLNRSFRYQLTIVGTRGWNARVVKPIAHNRFTIQSDQPDTEVSWQVTGIRHDRYANAHRVEVVVPKRGREK